MASKRVNIAYLTSCGKIYRHQWVSVSRRATSPRLCFRRRLSQPGCSVEIYMVSFRWLIWTGRSCCAHNWHWSAICPRNVLLTTGQLPHSQPLAPDRPILVSHTDIVSPYRLTCYWTVAIHEGQSCWSVSEKTHFMRPCMEQSLLSTVTCRMYTVFRKKHPLTFSFISPWMMCWFKQKLQWIYPRKGSFWQCIN